MRRDQLRSCMSVLLLVCGLPATALRAQGTGLRIIADTDTLVPGSQSTTFSGFFQLTGVDPDISGRNVVFTAAPTGIYGWFDGELFTIANLNSTFPGSGLPLGFGQADGSSPSISGNNVAFSCSNGRPGPRAVCAWINGQLQVVAASGVTPVPGSDEIFGTFFSLNGVSPAISGRNVAFSASSDTFNGVYARIDGELVTIADNFTPVPGEEGVTFQNFGQLRGNSPSIGGRNVAFFGQWAAGGGVYAYISGALRVIADTNTPVPGGSGNFVNPGPPEGGAFDRRAKHCVHDPFSKRHIRLRQRGASYYCRRRHGGARRQCDVHRILDGSRNQW